MTSTVFDAPSSLSVAALDAALDILLSNNFDADSKSTLNTFITILDNIISKPADDKVRTLKMENKFIQQKIIARRGGVDFLLACGFQVMSDPPLLSRVGEERLVLVNESTNHLLTARRLLQTRAIRDLHIDPNQLPPLIAPPTITHATLNGSQSAAASTGGHNFSFNPYAGHRFDANAHAAGLETSKPDVNYISPTEAKLLKLQQQKEELEKAARKQPPPRDWMALHSGQAMPIPSNNNQEDLLISGNDTSASTGSDASLIAQRLQRQMVAAREREQFSTKAMRDLKTLERQRVYKQATVTIQFPNGIKLVGKFLPSETVGAVKESLIKECLILGDANANASSTAIDVDGDVAMDGTAPLISLPLFDLFLTPPRRVLDDNLTLEQEGLVPAAKVFSSAVLELRSHLFVVRTMDFPVGKAVADASSAEGAGAGVALTKDAKDGKQTTIVSREEALLQRMMGGKPRMGDAASSNSNDASKKATKKPKWFG
ncbi:hypothetical protein MPSEU_000726600 [Mayamaea pseudoterrestris]|nr:hypothetical protein MPSEU_000726600 [Mayamaea pseudoterrestris]